jgi:hypothetical protein
MLMIDVFPREAKGLHLEEPCSAFYFEHATWARFGLNASDIQFRYPVFLINSSLLALTLYSLVITTPFYNNTIFSRIHDVMTVFDSMCIIMLAYTMILLCIGLYIRRNKTCC